ncbi:MAG: hypothetical protein U0Q19_08240 [Kineosporiaceae bacterium]
MNGPGPIYDNALRQLAAVELVAVCRWLGIEAPEESVRLSEALPAVTRYADLLVTTAGALTHVEFVRRVTPDLPLRMLDYRSRIMLQWPGRRVDQHLVVLAEGRLPDVLTDRDVLNHRIHVIYLRDCDPADFLGTPALAPLASLADATDRAHRAQLLRRSLEVIRDQASPHRTVDLASVAIVLAAIRLDAATIETARKEAGMPISLEGTAAGEIIAQRAAVRARAEGLTEGRNEGEISTLAAVLSNRFGPDPRIGDLARALHARAGDRAVELALGATSLDDLRG